MGLEHYVENEANPDNKEDVHKQNKTLAYVRDAICDDIAYIYDRCHTLKKLEKAKNWYRIMIGRIHNSYLFFEQNFLAVRNRKVKV